MKTVKFKDLPYKVQNFLVRTSTNVYMEYSIINLDALHSEYDWSKATDEERLAYAEWKYKDGTKFVLHNGYMVEVTEGAITTTYLPKPIETVIYAPVLGSPSSNSHEMIYNGAKWAEIVEEKEEPIFKAGDGVDHKYINSEWLSNGLIFTGGITSCGLYLCEDKHGNIRQCERIRKPDPDKVYREMAKEMIERYVNQINKHNHNEHIFVDDDCENMLIEAIKKGKEL